MVIVVITNDGYKGLGDSVSLIPRRQCADKYERKCTIGRKNRTAPSRNRKRLRHIIRIPQEARECSGIYIFGRRIKTLVFTTDIAIIRNCDADAVFAVYSFTPQSAISEAIIKSDFIPVFCGVGGGTTQGLRTVTLAKDVEAQGAVGVVLNAPVSDLNVRRSPRRWISRS